MSSQQQQQQQQQQSNVAIDVAQQLGQKQPPSNQQISELVEKTQQFIDQKKMDPNVSQQSTKVLNDLQGVLSATEQLNQNKNQDETLQRLVLETGEAGRELKQAGQQALNHPSVQAKGQQVQQQGQQLTGAVWSVLRTMVQSGEFRTQINSLIGLFQEMFLGTTSTTMDQQQQQGQSQGISEEKKREVAHNFLLVLRKLNQNESFRSGFQQLVWLFQDLSDESSYSTSLSSSSASSGPQPQQIKETVQQSEHVDTAFQDSKNLIERFSERPVDPFLEKNRQLFAYVRGNQELRQWFDDLVQMLRQVVENPQSVDEYELTQRSEELVNRAGDLSRDPQFKAKYTQVWSELQAIAASVRDDPDLKNLQDQTAAFLDNFTSVDANGQRQFNTDLMQELRSLLVPLFLAQLDNIPLPPIEGSNEDYDYYFDNVILHGQEIIPDMVKFYSESESQVNVRELSADKSKTKVFLQVASIQLQLSDIHFRFTRKTFPKLSDEGTANLRVEGDQGFSLKLQFKVELAQPGSVPQFKLQTVDADIQKLKIDIINAKHEFLLKLFAGIYQTRVKTMVEQNIEQKIKEVFGKIEGGLNQIFAKFPPSKLKEVASQKANQALNNGGGGSTSTTTTPSSFGQQQQQQQQQQQSSFASKPVAQSGVQPQQQQPQTAFQS